MANDRMFLHCPRCGENFMLAKRMGDSWYVGNNVTTENPLETQLNAFFEKHFACELSGDPYAFELYDESGPMKFKPALST
jgi:hypothetical protein